MITLTNQWNKVTTSSVLNNILRTLGNYYQTKLITPRQENVFKAFKLCSLDDLKVVMLGYDPYPQKNVATGLLFGNANNTKEENLSPSLKVIKNAIIPLGISEDNVIFDSSLETWAKQGVLLLNSALTTEVGKTGVHSMLWRPFIVDLLKNLSQYDTGIVYVLFGQQAQTFKPYINSKFNYILEEKHPSYYARLNKSMPSNIFTSINHILKNIYGTTIQWLQTDKQSE